MDSKWILLSLIVLAGLSVMAWAVTEGKSVAIKKSVKSESSVSKDTTLYTFVMKDIDGKDVRLSDYKGKVVLIVNVASKCGFTSQYKGLEALYREYKNKGFVVLGFPSNNFMGQEPGSNKEIKEFCTLKYDVTFPMFEKIEVKGKDQHALYQWLTSGGGDAKLAGPISWNFNKFLIGKDGKIITRWGSRTTPEDSEVVKEVVAALNRKPSAK